MIPNQHKKNTKQNQKDLTKEFSQISKYDFFLHNELQIVDYLYSIPYYKYFFYLFEKYQKISYHALHQEHFLPVPLPIPVIDKTNTNTNAYYLLTYPREKLIPLKEYLPSLSPFKRYLGFVLEMYKKLLESIQLLCSNNIVHNYLSWDTICINETQNVLLYQFGYSLNLTSENKTKEYLSCYLLEYSPEYSYWPFEFHLFTFMIKNQLESLSKSNIDTIAKDLEKRHPYTKRILFFKKEGLSFWYKWVNKPWSFIIEQIFVFFPTWDNYRLSILFLDIVEKQSNTSNLFYTQFSELLMKNIHWNPEKRLDIATTLTKAKELFYSTDRETFIDCIKQNSL